MTFDFKADWANRYPLLPKIIRILHHQQLEAYLVGGSVRDLLMGRASIVDLDFVVPGDGVQVARRVADTLKTVFYPLDAARGVGRVICDPPVGSQQKKLQLDFATFRGPGLLADLEDRDFTINAMALSLSGPPQLFDPLHGQRDLTRQQIKAVNPTVFEHDPVRVLRAIRQAVEFDFSIEPQTQFYLQQAASSLVRTSPERQRDELLKLLNTPVPGQAVQMLQQFQILPHLLPEIAAMVGVKQGPPHHLEVFEHTVVALDVWATMISQGLPEIAPNFRPAVNQYLAQSLAGEVTLQQLMPVALLWHDAGKPLTRTEEAGKIRFLGHEKESARLVSRAMTAFHFSNQAVDFVNKVVTHHMRPLLLAKDGGKISRRAIYRFFRDTADSSSEAGVAVSLHALADQKATYSPSSTEAQMQQQALLELVHQLLQAYFEQRDRLIEPPPLLTGRDLIETFGLTEGQLIGRLLNRLREAQAIGLVEDKAAALTFIKNDPDFIKAMHSQQN